MRDSAGVTIVVNDVEDGAGQPIWRVEESPGLRIGRGDGEAAYQFHRLSGALPTGGELIVADGGSGEIRRFDSAGTHPRPRPGGRPVGGRPDAPRPPDHRHRRRLCPRHLEG